MPDSDPEIEALAQNFSRNKEWAKRGEYQTRLAPLDEQNFQLWVWKNGIPFDPHWPPDQAMNDYDMRGFWKAMQKGDPLAARGEGGHFPDIWKTPYHPTFSRESMYAQPTAPRWDGDKLVDEKGRVVFDPAPPK